MSLIRAFCLGLRGIEVDRRVEVSGGSVSLFCREQREANAWYGVGSKIYYSSSIASNATQRNATQAWRAWRVCSRVCIYCMDGYPFGSRGVGAGRVRSRGLVCFYVSVYAGMLV